MQKMRDDTFENQFINVWLSLFNQTLSDLQSYYETAYESAVLGRIIFENQLANITKAVSKELFVKTYWQLFSEMQKNGTIDAHLYILYAIFGGDATIVMENSAPLHSIFHIATNSIALEQWVTRAGDNMITRDGDNLVFRKVLIDLTNAEIAALLQATANYGEYLEFDIDTHVDRNDYGLVSDFPIFYEDFGSVAQEPEVFADYGYVNQEVE